MIIFHTDHWGAMAHYIVLAVTKHKDDEKVLIFTENVKTRGEILEKLQAAGIFQKVVNGNEIRHPGAKLEDEGAIEKEIVNTIDKFLEVNSINIDLASKIYTATDIDGIFRYYLIQKKKKYVQVMMDSWDIYNAYKNHGLVSVNAATQSYMNILNRNHVYDGTNEYCEEIIAFPETEIRNDIVKNKIKRFDLSKHLDKLSRTDARKILKCFDVDIDSFSNIKRALLSNSEGYLWGIIQRAGYDGKSRVEQTLLYQLLIDFYSSGENGDLMIKAHPNNYLEWKKYFSIEELNKDMPIEFIRFNKECHLDKVIALQTTAVDKIRDKIDNVVLATADFATYYHSICKLYAVCKIFTDSRTDLQFEQVGFTEGFFTNYINNVMEVALSDWVSSNKFTPLNSGFRLFYSVASDDVRDINTRSIKPMDENSAVAILNINDNVPVERLFKDYLGCCTVFKITKHAVKDNVLLPLEDEFVYMVTKSKELRERLSAIKVDKRLNFTSVDMHAEALSDAETKLHFENKILREDCEYLKKKSEYLNSVILNDSLYQLRQVCDLEKYLCLLKALKNKTVFIAVKDNGGKNFTYSAVRFWHELGFKTEMDWLGWNSFVGIYDDKVIAEKAGVRADSSTYEDTYRSLKIKMQSMTYDKGNLASIQINGKEYAVNGRGINIVVYDNELCQVADSVCFDTFLPEIKCIRK